MMRLVVAIILGIQLAALVAVMSIDDDRNVVVIVPPAISILRTETRPQTPTPTPTLTPTCPAPSREHAAPRDLQLDEAVEHVRPSPTNASWIAAWNDQHIFISTDGGRVFARVLDGPGQVADVGFDCFGDVIAARDKMLGVRVHAAERWRTVPDLAALARVIGGGPDVVVVGAPTGTDYPTRIAASSDRGESWRFRDLDRAYEAANVTGRQSADGTIRVGVAIADCDYSGIERETWRANGASDPQRFATSGGSFGIYGDVTISGGKRWSNGEWRAIAGLDEYGEALEAPWPAVLRDGTVFRIDGATATRLPWCVDGTSPSIDPAGRVWMIDRNGQLAIAPRATGECHGAPPAPTD